MPAISASAPGKVILFGEHAVVYSRPAIAIPVHQIQAKAIFTPAPTEPPDQVNISAPDIDLQSTLAKLPEQDPLKTALLLTQHELGLSYLPAMNIRITSSIPVASGLGSGASVSVALIRGLATFLGRSLSDAQISALAYEVEKIHHGTPSGIDNTVITFAQPICFQRGQPPEQLTVAQPLHFVIADTGVASPTAQVVGDVRRAWLANPARLEAIFTNIGDLVEQALAAIAAGRIDEIGSLMNFNQEYLSALEVSSPELEGLIQTARTAGASGAKLSGAGRGGNMIAICTQPLAVEIARELHAAGAKRTIVTTLPPQVRREH